MMKKQEFVPREIREKPFYEISGRYSGIRAVSG